MVSSPMDYEIEITTNSDLNETIPHLFICNWNTANDVNLLNRHKIKVVITLTQEEKPKAVLEAYKALGIEYYHIRIDDSPSAPIHNYFNTTYKIIRDSIDGGKNVLVHCHAGVSRSATIVLYYLMQILHESLPDKTPLELYKIAFETVQRKRPIIQPNYGFQQQLIQAFEMKKNATNNLNNKSIEQFMSTPPQNSADADCHFFKDSNGKVASVICLTDSDFDELGNLKYFQDVNAVIFFWEPWCGYCTKVKPEFSNFSHMLSGKPIRAFAIEAGKNKSLMARINPTTWGYQIKGYPSIISYNKGKFFSEYAPSDGDTSKFRTAPDLLEYANGIGLVDVDLR